MFKQYRKLFVILVIALFLAACGGGGTSLLVAPSEDAAMNTDSPDNTSDEDTDKPDSSDTSETQDTDGDGVGDNSDAFPDDASETLDSDGDGTGDNADAFPNDASETLDSDGDGVGNNSDAFPDNSSETLDSDGDGIGDNSDVFPDDPSETLDSDGDGTGDNSDAFPNDASETLDSDKDGVGDNSDAFPNDPLETLDSDSDGVGDNSDAFPDDASETLDSDGDGTGDNVDAFPNDASETLDSDSDGIGDNIDAFPNDASETLDSDGDGVGNNSDVFPDDPSETLDSDGDGTGDNSDAFPNDASETLDSDKDGVGDNSDAFPNDPLETLDSDSDGIGDNTDAFPNNSSETMDTDGDGVGDNSDAFPDDASETLDSDGDGTGDNADAFPNDASETLDSDNDGTGDNSDAFPNDASETLDSDKDGVGDNNDAFTTTRATVQGTSAVDLLDYLKDQASGGPWGPEGLEWERTPKMPLWMRAPTVQVESSAAPELHRMTAKAVDLINDWLPFEHRMRIGAPTALRTDNSGDVPTGGIHMNFRYESDGGRANYHPIRDDRDPNDVPYLRAAVVRINPNSSWHNTFGLIVHELVHAMSLPGHVSENRHPTSIMPDSEYHGGPLPDEANLPRLPRIDGEALMAAYTIFNEGHTPDEINPTSLGPWASAIPAIHGEVRTDGGTAGFGVEYRTQWTRAWDEGPVPATTLAASSITGTATWTGEMVGFTDAGTAVEGVAGITVDVGRMDGTAAFTDLVSDDASWGPDLSSDINVNGNYFTDTGSEPRIDLEGQFRGTSHEAATGVFRWEDSETGNLTGAFGTIRDE